MHFVQAWLGEVKKTRKGEKDKERTKHFRLPPVFQESFIDFLFVYVTADC